MEPWVPRQGGIQGTLTQDRKGSHELHAVFVELEVDRPGMQDGAHQPPFSCAEPCEEKEAEAGDTEGQDGSSHPDRCGCLLDIIRKSERSPVQFLVRVPAWVAGSVPDREN